MSFYSAANGEDCEILSGSQKTEENFVNTSLVLNEDTSKAMFKATENVTKLETQANVKQEKTTKETLEKRYKLNQISNKIGILSESLLIMETKNNLEKAADSLPAETKTYVNSKEAQGLDEEISVEQYSCITSSEVNRIVSALHPDTTIEITSTNWTPISGSDHDNERSSGAVIRAREVEFTDSEVCNETDMEENLHRKNKPFSNKELQRAESYEFLPLHSVVRASSISMSKKNQHEENTSDVEDLDSDTSDSDNENKDNENDSTFQKYVTLFGKKVLVDPYINKKGCRHDEKEKCFNCYMKLRTGVPAVLKQLMEKDDGLCKCKKK